MLPAADHLLDSRRGDEMAQRSVGVAAKSRIALPQNRGAPFAKNAKQLERGGGASLPLVGALAMAGLAPPSSAQPVSRDAATPAAAFARLVAGNARNVANLPTERDFSAGRDPRAAGQAMDRRIHHRQDQPPPPRQELAVPTPVSTRISSHGHPSGSRSEGSAGRRNDCEPPQRRWSGDCRPENETCSAAPPPRPCVRHHQAQVIAMGHPLLPVAPLMGEGVKI
jgi:hypothetical protein